MLIRLLVLVLALLALALTPLTLTAERAYLFDPEIVGVSDEGAFVTWTTSSPGRHGERLPLILESFAEVDRGQSAWSTHFGRRPQAFHHIGIDGLEADRRYPVRIMAGTPEAASELGQASFKTLPRPPGRLLFTFATASDLQVTLPGNTYYSMPIRLRRPTGEVHVLGRDNAGQMFRKTVPLLKALVRDLNRLEIEFAVMRGDLTQGAREREFARARRELDRLDMPYFAVPGNHDALSAPAYGKGKPRFREYFGERQQSFVHKGVHFVLVDTTPEEVTGGLTHEGFVDAERVSALATTLALVDLPTLVFLHHPLNRTYFPDGAPAGAELERILAADGNVKGVFTGHGHRNAVRPTRLPGGPPEMEGAAVDMFPSGYHVVRVFEGGFVATFNKISAPKIVEQSRETQRYGRFRGGIDSLGQPGDRSFAYLYRERMLVTASY